MKVEYKNIIGQLVDKNLPCRECCFSCLIDCIPYTMHRCNRHIFKEARTQIFEL
jgi:hypothetical protein